MQKVNVPMTRNSRSAVILLACATGAGASTVGAPATAPAKTTTCTAPAYRQFDFWLGNWDVFDVASPTVIVAHVRVVPILEGCVLHEFYEGADGHQGQSFSIFDASRQVWHQSWVTNNGQLLVIEGGMQAGSMILGGADRTPDGKERRVRGTWKCVHEGVRESAQRSTDGGLTWEPWFDLLFHPHPGDSHMAGAPRCSGSAP